MRSLERIYEAVFGPRRIPLAGLHVQILEAAGPHLKPEHRAAFDAQVAARPKTRFQAYRDWADLWIADTDAPRIVLPNHTVLLVRVKFKFGGKGGTADVWAIKGRVALIEYKGSLGWRPEAAATGISVKALYRPERDPEEIKHPASQPIEAPVWLAPHLLAEGIEVLAPDRSKPSIAPFTEADVPEDLRAFWAETGGLTYKALALLGPSEVEVRSFAGEDRLLIGRLDYEEIGISRAKPGTLTLFWHDDAPEYLGASLLDALPALIRHAAA